MKNQPLLLLALIACFTTIAQEATTETTGPLTIDEQFADVIKSSNSYEDYKVIKKYKINALKKNTKERIDELQGQIISLNSTIEKQQAEISKLNTDLSGTQQTLEATNQEKDSMNFFGKQMSKSGYKTLMWGIAGLLLAGLLLFIFRFKNSNSITKEARYKLSEAEQEFEEYRKKALEKEQKLGRQLQDERNKLLKAAKG